MRTRMVWKFAAALVAAVFATAGLAAPAHAVDSRDANRQSTVITPQVEEGPYRIKNQQTGRCVGFSWLGARLGAGRLNA